MSFCCPTDGPKLPSVSVSPSGEIVEGSSVTLTCSSDANPAADYTWYKENQTLYQGPEGSYHFISISSEDRGIYYCKSENQYGQINSSSLLIDVQCKYKTSAGQHERRYKSLVISFLLKHFRVCGISFFYCTSDEVILFK